MYKSFSEAAPLQVQTHISLCGVSYEYVKVYIMRVCTCVYVMSEDVWHEEKY